MNIENIVIEIGKMTIPAVLTFFAGLTVGTLNERRQLKIQSYKDQLINLYEPLYTVIDENHFRHGAHHYTDLSASERQEILDILRTGSAYTNSSVYVTTMELRWAINDEDENLNKIFEHLENLISNEFHHLRKKLKLPEIKVDKAKRFIG